MLFIYGRRKQLRFHSPAWADKLAAKPGNRVVAFDTGHWVMTQQPERFNEVVRSWLLAGAQELLQVKAGRRPVDQQLAVGSGEPAFCGSRAPSRHEHFTFGAQQTRLDGHGTQERHLEFQRG